MVAIISPNAHFQIPELENSLGISTLQYIGSGRQVQVYAIPGKNLVMKIPRQDMELVEPARRKKGLELIAERMNPATYLPTIHIPRSAHYQFVEFQEQATTLYSDHLKKMHSTLGEEGFSNTIQDLINFEKILWSRGLFLMDWAGQFENFADGTRSIRLFDFGSITCEKDQAINFLQREIEGKIEDVVQWLHSTGFSTDCSRLYRQIAQGAYKPKLFSDIWSSSL